MKTWVAWVNGACLLGAMVSLAWETFALGTPEFFYRQWVVLVFLLPCLGFWAYRVISEKKR